MKLVLWALSALLLVSAPAANAAVWANIKTVDCQVLNNGVQVMVKADGVLEFWDPDRPDMWDRDPGKRSQIRVRFPDAKNATGKTVIKVDKPPVSYIELSMPQDAKEGIGVEMRVVFLYPTTARARATDDNLGAIITVDSDVTLEQSTATSGVEVSTSQKLDVRVAPTTGLLTVMAIKANLHEVLARIGRLTGTNVLVDDLIDPGSPVGGGGQQITIVLADATLKDTLAAIAAAAGLGVSLPEEDGGVYTFSAGIPTELSAYRLASTRSFPVVNVEAEKAQQALPNFLYPHLHVNNDQNAIVVSAPGLMLDKIGRDLQVVDVASPQIMVEALAVEFMTKEDLERSVGLGYQGWDLLTGSDSANGSITFGTMVKLPQDFQARLSAMEREGTVKVWAKPRMAVMNGRNASIFIGQTRYVEVEIPSYGGTTKQVQGVDVGVKLELQGPWTGGNGEITCLLRPTVSSISEVDPNTGLPTISERSASTTVRVKDGETVVIGGLVRKEEYVTDRKIPILGDIPLFGHFFRSKSRSAVNSELVILVTPRILDAISARPLQGSDSHDMELYQRENADVQSSGEGAAGTPSGG